MIQGLRETEVEGAYALILEFYSPLIALETWQQKQEKMEKFFAPEVQVQVTQPAENEINLALITMPKVEE